MGRIANRQSLVFSECGQLSQVIPQVHVEWALHQRTQSRNSNCNTTNAGSTRTKFCASRGGMPANERCSLLVQATELFNMRSSCKDLSWRCMWHRSVTEHKVSWECASAFACPANHCCRLAGEFQETPACSQKFVPKIWVRLYPTPSNQQSDEFPHVFALEGPQTELQTPSQDCEQTELWTGVSEIWSCTS